MPLKPILAILLSAALVLPSESPAAPAASKPVAATVAQKAQAGEWVEALILLDDSAEVSAQAAAESAKPLVHRMSRADYETHIQRKTSLLNGLKFQSRQTLAGSDLEELTQFPVFPILHVRIKSAKALERLAKHPKVLSIDEVGRREHALTQSLPLIQQPAAQSAGHTGAGTTVCVLDTGADYTLPAFGSCTTPDGACKVTYAQDFAPDDGFLDDNGHGTNVSGIVVGVAPGAKVAALDVFTGTGAWDSDIIAAINWCVTNKAAYNIASINMSLGGTSYTAPVPTTDSWGTSIQNAIDAGIMVVAASGNSAKSDAIDKPGAYEGVVSVGAVYDSNFGSIGFSVCSDATTAADKITCFSNSASFLTMLAPGSRIVAAGIDMSGTSQATPHVAGAAAVLKALYPAETVEQHVNRLKRGPQIVDSRNGVSTPRLDLVTLADPAAGSIGFPTGSASVAEDGTSIALTATRSNGTTGNVSVSYSTADGMATSGTDYTAAAGNLSWADGEGGSKTITIPIADNSTFEPAEEFTVNLSGATNGAVLGIATVTVTIADNDPDNFPDGGTLPAGWVQPASSAAPWTVASDSVYSGNNSLKSGTITHSQISGLSYTGEFVAGYVTFARRVSSEGGYDYLRFYIDGVRQAEWSGEVAWGEVAFPITAGTHEVKWQYEKDTLVSSGSDTAWIDSVTISLAVPANGTCGTANGMLTATEPSPSTLCSSGITSVVSGSPSAFTWSCLGVAGGTTASCAAPRGYVVNVALTSGNGSLLSGTQMVAYGQTVTIAASPDPGYAPLFDSTCQGTQSGFSYITGAISTDCAITAAFHDVAVLEHYYQAILNRSPDEGGLVFWLGEAERMARNGVAPTEAYVIMALWFFHSQEFLARGLDDDQFIGNLYLTFFDRVADQGGLDYWRSQLVAGMPRDMVMYAFMFSPEFATYMAQHVGTTSVRAEIGMVVDFYRGALGRLPDDEGLRYWVNRFRDAQCSVDPLNGVYASAIDIAGLFFNSEEYWSTPPTNREYVSDLYNAFMRRSGDLAGFNFWVDELDMQLRTHDEERRQFIDSPEFGGRVQAVAEQGCTAPLP